MNIKSFDAGYNLNDRRRDAIRDPNDNRLTFIDGYLLQEDGEQRLRASSTRLNC